MKDIEKQFSQVAKNGKPSPEQAELLRKVSNYHNEQQQTLRVAQ